MQVKVVRPRQYLAFPKFRHVLHVLIATSFKSRKRLHLCIQILTCCPTAFPSLNHQLLLPKKLLIVQVDSNLSIVLPFLFCTTTWRSYMEEYRINWKPLTVASVYFRSPLQATYVTTSGHQYALPISLADIHCLNVTTHILCWKEKNVHFPRPRQNNSSVFQ